MKLAFIIFISFCSLAIFAGEQKEIKTPLKSTSQDSLIFLQLKEKVIAQQWDTLPTNELIIRIGNYFFDTPYIAYTLEGNNTEQLIINLRGLDCTTFVENNLALARCFKSVDKSISNYYSQLQLIRYRNGQLNGYTSRLHYFSDWIYDKGQLGIIKDMTQEIGGIPFPVMVNYMSNHPDKYAPLINPDTLALICTQEKAISTRSYFYIPKAELSKYEQYIKDGDIIAITTNLLGLYISHVGYAQWKNNELHFLHASQGFKKVMLTPETLFQYLATKKQHTGIMVIRPL